MNEAAETKVCPFCAETIKAAAKRCPFCNSRLVRYALFRQELVLGLNCLIGLACVTAVGIWLFPYGMDGEGPSFAWHRNDLEAKNVMVGVEDRGTDAYDYNVSGVVTNKGRYPWRVQEFELTVTNTRGIADVRHAGAKEPFVVQPHTEHAFIFHCSTSLTNTIVAARARVENARDGNGPRNDNDD
jgi:hypothetical protein